MVISFARSPAGQRMIRQARERYDTPQNRAKLREALNDLRAQRRR